MSEKITCEDFNAGLTDFVLGRSGAGEAAAMEEHLASCAGCREILEMKRALIFDPGNPEETVPDEVAESLAESVLADVAAARESGWSRRSWASRYLMPAMAAAIILFVFLTGFMLGEIRNLHREAGELREDVAAMEMVLTGRSLSVEGTAGGRSVFGHLNGGLQSAPGGMTFGEAVRFLEALPADTPVLSEGKARSLIAENRRLRRLAENMKERPWEGGLTSGELLTVIITLDIAPDTRIPDEWNDTYGKAKGAKEDI